MAAIAFERYEAPLEILNPLKGFIRETQLVEIRKDPLLGDTSVYNPVQREKVKTFFSRNDESLIEDMVRESSLKCLFCGENVEKSTPRYPPEIVPDGRLRVGEALLFPNLFPVAKYHAVISVSRRHFLRLPEFSPELIADSLRAAQAFTRLVYARDPEALFVAVNANYLFPAGASLVHPHLQMIMSPLPYSYHGRLLTAAAEYHEDNGSCFYRDLIETERIRGERYVAGRGQWHWMTAFSPLGMNEITAVHESSADFAGLPYGHIDALAYGISRVLLLYDELGHLSFNYSLLSAKAPAAQESFRCVLRIVNRQNLTANYRNDDFFLQKLLQSDFIVNLPEELALRLRPLF